MCLQALWLNEYSVLFSMAKNRVKNECRLAAVVALIKDLYIGLDERELTIGLGC
jgi:hypothetical protein